MLLFSPCDLNNRLVARLVWLWSGSVLKCDAVDSSNGCHATGGIKKLRAVAREQVDCIECEVDAYSWVRGHGAPCQPAVLL